MQKSAVFRVLGDPIRLKIVEILIEHELNGQQLETYLIKQGVDIRQAGISYHLKRLLGSHLIVARQEKHYRYYSCSCSDLVMGLLAITRAFIALTEKEKQAEETGLNREEFQIL